MSRVAVQVAVFGGLRVVAPAVDVAQRPPRERVILASLIAARGRTVSIGELVDSLWGEEPPPTAVNQVQRHVGELRRLLEPHLAARASGTAVLGAGEGYRLDTAVARSDLDEVDELWTAARAAPPETAASLYAKALAVAAGAPFAGLGWDVLTRPEFAAIERDRVALALDAADCALGLPDPSPLVDPVERIAADAPLNERLQARLVRLLGRIGRRAEAMGLYDTARTRLHEELAAAPGAELRDALDEVLTEDQPSKPAAAPVAEPPRRLPLAPGSVVDRIGTQELLDQITASALRGEPAILAISGMAGIGKTTLALQWAHAVAPHFPDGQLFVNVRGYSPAGESLSTVEALLQLLTDVGGNVAGLAPDATVLTDAFRKEIGDRRLIVVIDNVADIGQARALLPGAAGCLVIVTSRSQLAGLVVKEGAVPVPLDRLSDEQSREVLARRLGEERLHADPTSVDSIIASCAGLPLALALAAAASGSSSRSAMHDVADALSATASALDAFAVDADNDLRSAFGWSYSSLTTDAALLFRLAPVHPGVTHPRNALASIARFDLPRATEAIAELVSANMLVPVARYEYAMHDLLRVYAQELTAGSDELPDAQRRLVGHYVHTTRRAFLTFGREPVVGVGSDPPVPEAIASFASPDDAFRWYLSERKAIIDTFGVALAIGLDREAALIALDWRPMRQFIDSPTEIVVTSSDATAAAERSGDERLEVELRRDLGSQLGLTGRKAESKEEFRRALESYRAWGDAAGESNTLRNMSDVAETEAEQNELSEQAVDAARRSGRADILAICLTDRCEKVLLYGTTDELSAVAEEAEIYVQAARAEYLMPYTAMYRAFVHARNGRFAEALDVVSVTDDSLDVMIRWHGAVTTVIAAAGADDRVKALAARDRLRQLASDYPDFLSVNDSGHAQYNAWVDEAIAAMEARLSE